MEKPSSFSFMENGSETSGFNFISAHEDSNNDSSFSFLNVHELNTNNVTDIEKISGELNNNIMNEINELLSNSDCKNLNESQQDIKFDKMASTKDVKKKKKTKRVGFGREDLEIEDTNEQSHTLPLTPISNSSYISDLPPMPISNSSYISDLPPMPISNSSYISALPPIPISNSICNLNESLQRSFIKTTVTDDDTTAFIDEIIYTKTSDFDKNEASSTVPIILSKSPVDIDIPPPVPKSLTDRNVNNNTNLIINTPPTVTIVNPSNTPISSEKSQAVTFKSKSQEVLIKLGICLSDLSRLHSSALAGKKRFEEEIYFETSETQKTRLKLKDAEQEQVKFAQEEEFEKAEQMNEVIKLYISDIERRLGITDELKASMKRLEGNYAEERNQCIQEFSECLTSLKLAKEKLISITSQMVTTVIKQNDGEISRILAELERIGLEKSNFEREEDSLHSDSARIEDAIKSQMGDLCIKKEEISTSMDTVQVEIKVLEEQLAYKRLELLGYQDDFNKLETKIKDIRKKYDRQLQRVTDRKATLNETKAECLSEEKALLEEKSHIENKEQKNIEDKLLTEKWTKLLENDIFIADTILSKMLYSQQSKTYRSRTVASIVSFENSGISSEIDILNQKLQSVSDLLTVAQEELLKIELQMEQILIEIKSISEQVPKLEIDKKLHANNKRFKEAANVANELKLLVTKKEYLDIEFQELNTRKEQLLIEIDTLEVNCNEANDEVSNAYKSNDLLRFDELLLSYKEVYLIKRKVEGKQKSSDNNELTDFCNAVLMFLNSEINTLLQEAEEIKEQYKLSQSLDDIEFHDEVENDTTSHGIPRDETQEGVRSDSTLKSNNDETNDIVVEERIQTTTVLLESSNIEDSNNNSNYECNEITDSETTIIALDVDTTEKIVDEEVKKSLIKNAQELLQKYSILDCLLQESTSNEDYEKAAEVFESITSLNLELDQILLEIGCTREDISLNKTNL